MPSDTTQIYSSALHGIEEQSRPHLSDRETASENGHTSRFDKPDPGQLRTIHV